MNTLDLYRDNNHDGFYEVAHPECDPNQWGFIAIKPEHKYPLSNDYFKNQVCSICGKHNPNDERVNTMKEDKKHELAREFMDKFDNIAPRSLDEWLLENINRITEGEYQAGRAISDLFDEEETEEFQVQIGWSFHEDVPENKELRAFLSKQLSILNEVLIPQLDVEKPSVEMDFCGGSDYISYDITTKHSAVEIERQVKSLIDNTDLAMTEYLYITAN